MADVQFDIEGVDALVAKLDTISDDMKRRGGRFALRKAANMIRDAAKQNAQRVDDPESPENIAENIAVRFSTRTFKRTGDLMFRVGVMGTANPSNASKTTGLPGGSTQHWRWVEMGKEGVPARPFMRPALAENISAATNEFVTQYGKAVDRAIKRAARQAGGK